MSLQNLSNGTYSCTIVQGILREVLKCEKVQKISSHFGGECAGAFVGERCEVGGGNLNSGEVQTKTKFSNHKNWTACYRSSHSMFTTTSTQSSSHY